MGTGLAAHPHRCRQYFKSTVVAWGAEPLKVRSPRTSIARVPPVGESQVCGPSLSPADVLDEPEWGVACGWSTGVREVATLFALTQNPCQKWEALGYGKAVLLYQRTQQVLQAARLLPAHRRLPHQAFLSGLWWKLLSLQPLRLLACNRLCKMDGQAQARLLYWHWWIRFETAMTSDDWEGAISLLVSNLHCPDQELLVLPQSCVAGQPIVLEEAQALLLKNFRVGEGAQSACAQWLTEMA